LEKICWKFLEVFTEFTTGFKYLPLKRYSMVSLEKYIKTFIAVVPERGKTIQSLSLKKKAINARFLKINALDEKDIQELLLIIGQDKKLFFFKDKKWKPTLRHTLGKCIRSIEFFINTCPQFSSSQYLNEKEFASHYGNTNIAYRRMQVYTPKIKQFLEEFYEDAKSLLSELKGLEKVYSIQYSYLEMNNLSEYKKFLEEEQQHVQNLTAILKSLSTRQKSLWNFVRLFIEEFKKPAKDDFFVKEAAPWIVAGTLTLILIILLVAVSEFAGQGWIKNPEQPIAISILAFAGTTLLGVTLGMLNTLQINPVENLISAVNQFVRRAV